MINRLSHREEPGPGHPPAPPGASREQSETQQPTARPGRQTARPGITTACSSVNPVAITSIQIPRPADQARSDIRSPAWNLPALVLNKIVGYLPPGDQYRCAQVCRHWYDCLPAPRVRLMQWLQKNAPVSCLADPGLGRGFNARTGPFFQAANNPALPALTHLQQEQELTETWQDSQQPPHAPATPDLLASLVHYGLNQQLTRTHRLELRPSPLDWPDAVGISSYYFSPCSRRLAFICKRRAESSQHLRLYSWEKGVWQRCRMVTDVVEPVTSFIFTQAPPDTLISAHGVKILAWQKTQDSTTWHSTLVCHVSQPYTVSTLYSMSNGDQIIIAENTQREETMLRVLFCRPLQDGKGWTTRVYSYKVPLNFRVTMAWDAHPQSCQLALIKSTRTHDCETLTNKVHIWRKGREGSSPWQWGYNKCALPQHDSRPYQVVYSPDGHYLLGGLTNGQACLWALDAQCQLHEQLITDYLYQPEHRLSFLISFRRDSKQLALLRSWLQVQLFFCDPNGHWQPGPLLEAPPVPHAPGDNTQITIQLSASGRTLVRQTAWSLDIWHQAPAASWQHFVQHRKEEGHRFPPYYSLLQPGELVCTTIHNPELTLRIYGPDNRGQLVTKACMPVTTVICDASPDGLSLLLGDIRCPPSLLQLVPAQEHHRCRLL